jgi:hypothetical protein
VASYEVGEVGEEHGSRIADPPSRQHHSFATPCSLRGGNCSRSSTTRLGIPSLPGPSTAQEPPHKVQLYLGHATIQQTLGIYYHALIGNQGELRGLERMLEQDRKALPENTSE